MEKEKNNIIYYILFWIIIFCIIYIVESNNLFELMQSNNQMNNKSDNKATKMSIYETIQEQQNMNINENQTEQKEGANQTEETVDNQSIAEQTTLQEQKNVESEDKIPAKMAGFEVLGKLVIEKVNISKNILNETSKNSLKVSATKLYGPNINQIGNFCICGHNWKSMLKRALELEIDDTFYLIDRKTLSKVNYKIYNIYTCMPKDVECLNQNTDGKKEVTIITCNPGGITRLIIKAREI